MLPARVFSTRKDTQTREYRCALVLSLEEQQLTFHFQCSVRTSSGTFLSRGQDEIVKSIEERIAKYTMLPITNGEGLQV